MKNKRLKFQSKKISYFVEYVFVSHSASVYFSLCFSIYSLSKTLSLSLYMSISLVLSLFCYVRLSLSLSLRLCLLPLILVTFSNQLKNCLRKPVIKIILNLRSYSDSSTASSPPPTKKSSLKQPCHFKIDFVEIEMQHFYELTIAISLLFKISLFFRCGNYNGPDNLFCHHLLQCHNCV